MLDVLLKQINDNDELRDNKAFCERLAAALHTFYIRGENYENEIMKSIAKSQLSNDVVLMPKQLEMLYFIKSNKNVVLSAPTSFGKSFVILEYIRRLSTAPHLIIYVVHTKSLLTEVMNNIRLYFNELYNVVDDFESLDDNKSNILVMISDGQNIFNYFDSLKHIDILIIDEAYNLSKNESGRFLTIFNTCHAMMKISEKIILAGPFIKDVKDLTNDNYDFKLFKSDYSPVTELIIEGDDIQFNNPSEKYIQCLLNNENTIGFINSKDKIYNQLNELSDNHLLARKYSDPFIEWMKEYFPDFWVLPKLMEKGISVYHSSFPKYLNIYGMDLFNKRILKGLLTTSAILEGVNTSAKNVVIFETESGRNDNIVLTPFQFFNLCGRAGRLNQEIVGHIYNYGSPFTKRYKERSLLLVIGLEPETAEMKFDLGIHDDSTKEIEEIIKKELGLIGINYLEWYDKNKFFFGNNSSKLLLILNVYANFKINFKRAIGDELLRKDKKGLNKKSILNYIYNCFTVPSGCNFKQGRSLSVPSIIHDLISSRFGGITLSFKDFLNGSSYFSQLINKTKSIAEQNRLMVTIMKIAYDYIQYDFNYSNTLLKEFINHDSYFCEDDRKKVNESYFNRINSYLKNTKDNKVSKYLSDLGLIPPLIKKINALLMTKELDLNTLTNKQIYVMTKDAVINNKSYFTDYELINLQNVRLL